MAVIALSVNSPSGLVALNTNSSSSSSESKTTAEGDEYFSSSSSETATSTASNPVITTTTLGTNSASVKNEDRPANKGGTTSLVRHSPSQHKASPGVDEFFGEQIPLKVRGVMLGDPNVFSVAPPLNIINVDPTDIVLPTVPFIDVDVTDKAVAKDKGEASAKKVAIVVVDLFDTPEDPEPEQLGKLKKLREKMKAADTPEDVKVEIARKFKDRLGIDDITTVTDEDFETKLEQFKLANMHLELGSAGDEGFSKYIDPTFNNNTILAIFAGTEGLQKALEDNNVLAKVPKEDAVANFDKIAGMDIVTARKGVQAQILEKGYPNNKFEEFWKEVAGKGSILLDASGRLIVPKVGQKQYIGKLAEMYKVYIDHDKSISDSQTIREEVLAKIPKDAEGEAKRFDEFWGDIRDKGLDNFEDILTRGRNPDRVKRKNEYLENMVARYQAYSSNADAGVVPTKRYSEPEPRKVPRSQLRASGNRSGAYSPSISDGRSRSYNPGRKPTYSNTNFGKLAKLCDNYKINNRTFTPVRVPSGDLYVFNQPKGAGGSLAGKTFCLDAGHQGYDGGAGYGGGLNESQLNRLNTLRLAEQLIALGANVIINIDQNKASWEQSKESAGSRDTMFNEYLRSNPEISTNEAIMMSIHSNATEKAPDKETADYLMMIYRNDNSRALLEGMMKVEVAGNTSLDVVHSGQSRGSGNFSQFIGENALLAECGFAPNITQMMENGGAGFDGLRDNFLLRSAIGLAKGTTDVSAINKDISGAGAQPLQLGS